MRSGGYATVFGLRPLRATWRPPSFSASASVTSSSRAPLRASANVMRTVAPFPSGISSPLMSDIRTVFLAMLPPRGWRTVAAIGRCLFENSFVDTRCRDESGVRRAPSFLGGMPLAARSAIAEFLPPGTQRRTALPLGTLVRNATLSSRARARQGQVGGYPPPSRWSAMGPGRGRSPRPASARSNASLPPTTSASRTASARTGEVVGAVDRSRPHPLLAALFHPHTPNDVAPGGYNATEPPGASRRARSS